MLGALRRAALAAALTWVVTGGSAWADGDLVDGIAAQVGTEVVLVSEVTRLTGPMEKELRAQGATDRDIAVMQADVLEKLIERELLASVAERAEIEASSYEIDEAVAAIAKENGISVDVLKSSVEAQGLSFEVYRQRLGDEIVQQKVMGGMVTPKVQIEEEEVRARYEELYAEQPTGGEEVHVRHLLVPAADEKPASLKAACAEVKAAAGRLKTGADFMTVASETSRVEPELGWLYADSLAPWMKQVVTDLEPGQHSDVIQLPFGCAILQLVERREYQQVSYEEAKEKIRAQLFEEKFQQEYRKFMEKLRDQTYIERKGVFAEAERLGISSPEAEEEAYKLQ